MRITIPTRCETYMFIHIVLPFKIVLIKQVNACFYRTDKRKSLEVDTDMKILELLIFLNYHIGVLVDWFYLCSPKKFGGAYSCRFVRPSLRLKQISLQITFVPFVGTFSYLHILLFITKYRSSLIFRFESFTFQELCPLKV